MLLSDQPEQKRRCFLQLRLRKQLPRPIEDEATHLAMPAEQRLRLWANALEVLQVIQLAEQTTACLELFVQRVAVSSSKWCSLSWLKK